MRFAQRFSGCAWSLVISCVAEDKPKLIVIFDSPSGGSGMCAGHEAKGPGLDIGPRAPTVCSWGWVSGGGGLQVKQFRNGGLDEEGLVPQ